MDIGDSTSFGIAAAARRSLQIIRNMRAPESSLLFRLFGSNQEEACRQENLRSWRFSGRGSLPDLEVWIEARRLPDRVAAIVQPE